MFHFFGNSRFTDPKLGELTRSRGYWRGTVAMEAQTDVPLAVAGNRTAPDPAALAAAHDVAALFSARRGDIARALHEHCTPHLEAIAAGELPVPDTPFPASLSPKEIWTHVQFAFVCIGQMGGMLTVEFGLHAAWDEEHILGARLQAGKLIELCGSTIPP